MKDKRDRYLRLTFVSEGIKNLDSSVIYHNNEVNQQSNFNEDDDDDDEDGGMTYAISNY